MFVLVMAEKEDRIISSKAINLSVRVHAGELRRTYITFDAERQFCRRKRAWWACNSSGWLVRRRMIAVFPSRASTIPSGSSGDPSSESSCRLGKLMSGAACRMRSVAAALDSTSPPNTNASQNSRDSTPAPLPSPFPPPDLGRSRRPPRSLPRWRHPSTRR